MLRSIQTLVCLLAVSCTIPGYAADTVKFKPLGGATQDAANIPLKNPEGITCGKGTVLVADTGNGRFVRYTLANDELKNGVELKVAQVSYPLRLESAPLDKVLALDGKTRKIARLAADGSFEGYLEFQNVTSPTDVVPRSMTVDAKGTIYVLDVFGDRVLVLDPGGAYTRQVALPKEHGFVSDLAVDQKGAIYVLDSQNAQVYKAAPDAASFLTFATGLQAYMYLAVTIDIDAQGRAYLLDQSDSGVVLLGPDGSFQGRYLSFGWKVGQLNSPAQACLAENGVLVVADRNNSRIQTFKIQ
jgi:DNA-binding beta-propeller fold protein YncE